MTEAQIEQMAKAAFEFDWPKDKWERLGPGYHQDRYKGMIRAAFTAAPVITSEALDPALVGIPETVEEVGGWWKPCSGCYDTEDGHPTQKYAYSRALNTDVGCGCHECGGLGAVWEYYSDTDLAAMQEEFLRPEKPSAPEPVAWITADAIENLQAEGMCALAAGRKYSVVYSVPIYTHPPVTIDT